MTTMEQAMIQAGVPVPSKRERIWRFVKDNPGKTSAEMVKALSGIPAGTIYGQLSMMTKCGMLYTEHSRSGTRSRALIYFTDMDSYKTLPAPKAGNGKTEQAPAPVVTPPAADQVMSVTAVDQLTVAQARQLYLQLKKMFG